VYFDHDAMIYLKNVPENQAIIAKYAITLSKWKSPGMDLKRLGPKKVLVFPFIDRAKMLMALKLDGPALSELNMALKVSPDTPDTYQLKGDILGRLRKYQSCFENFRIAVMLDSSDRHSRRGLAWAYEKIGDKVHAISQYERLLADNPKDAKITERLKTLKEGLKK
jgi:tetratricopeptide (TPR) repeat protein